MLALLIQYKSLNGLSFTMVSLGGENLVTISDSLVVLLLLVEFLYNGETYNSRGEEIFVLLREGDILVDVHLFNNNKEGVNQIAGGGEFIR